MCIAVLIKEPRGIWASVAVAEIISDVVEVVRLSLGSVAPVIPAVGTLGSRANRSADVDPCEGWGAGPFQSSVPDLGTGLLPRLRGHFSQARV